MKVPARPGRSCVFLDCWPDRCLRDSSTILEKIERCAVRALSGWPVTCRGRSEFSPVYAPALAHALWPTVDQELWVDGGAQLLAAEGLEQKVDGPEPEGLDDFVLGAFAVDENDGCFAVQLFKARLKFQAAEVRHLHDQQDHSRRTVRSAVQKHLCLKSPCMKRAGTCLAARLWWRVRIAIH